MHKALVLSLLAAGLLLAGCKKPQDSSQSLNTDPALSPDALTPPPAPPASTDWTSPPTPPAPPAAPVRTVPPAPPVRTAPSTAGQREHTVQVGETLWKISATYYGRASQANVQKIVDANPGLEADKIKIGQVIRIPE